MSKIIEHISEGEINKDASEHFKAVVQGTSSIKFGSSIGSGLSSLHVVPRMGIESDDDFGVDIGQQLMSSGFKLKEINLGQAAKNAAIGIVIGESTGHYSEPAIKNIKKSLIGVSTQKQYS